jgi:allantoicase
MYPDGGIARFRLYGTPVPVWPQDVNQIIDLAHVSNGGVAIKWSDAHFGGPDNLLLSGRGVDMSDGWETARSRGKDHVDWAIIKLGSKGVVDHVVVDTAFYLGNFPQYVTVDGINAKEGESVDVNSAWKPIVGKSKMGPDREHTFKSDELLSSAKDEFTHVKLTMIPDGGVKRIRIFGKRVPN